MEGSSTVLEVLKLDVGISNAVPSVTDALDTAICEPHNCAGVVVVDALEPKKEGARTVLGVLKYDVKAENVAALVFAA